MQTWSTQDLISPYSSLLKSAYIIPATTSRTEQTELLFETFFVDSSEILVRISQEREKKNVLDWRLS